MLTKLSKNPKNTSLLINMKMENHTKDYIWMKYPSFHIDDESNKFMLHFHTGYVFRNTQLKNVGMNLNNGKKFSTFDQDNDPMDG